MSFSHRLCIAPMLHYTDRHYRYFMRLMTRYSVLYTEMHSTAALLHKTSGLISPLEIEHPVAFQISGNNPIELIQCAKRIEAAGYDEINFNVGCPSDRAQLGHFGACLLKEPQQIIQCVQALKSAVSIPISIKMRLGLIQSSVDYSAANESFEQLMLQLSAVGCNLFIIHARLAQLKNLSPKANRTRLPLHYDLVYQLKQKYPQLEIVLNGGISSLEQAQWHLQKVDGVMIGQAAYKNPYLFAQADTLIFNKNLSILSREEVFERYQQYREDQQQRGISDSLLKRPILNLYHGCVDAKQWKMKWLGKK